MHFIILFLGALLNCYSYSKAPISGAEPLKGRPTSSPASIKSLPATSFRKSISGKLPSSFLGEANKSISIATKSEALVVIPFCHPLLVISIVVAE